MDPTLAANFMGSAAAGVIARICTHPLDTAKARLQAVGSGASAYRGPWDVLVRTAQTEGLQGLYRGFGAVIVGGTPGTVLYLCSYEIAKEKLAQAIQRTNDRGTASDFAVHFASGMIAEAVACIIYVPVDVVKERLQVQHAANNAMDGYYSSSLHALKTISHTEGLLSLYKGYGATLLSFGTYSGLFFLFYERLLDQTRVYLERTSPSFSEGQRAVPFHWTVICSCTAGAAASWLTSPLDMAKLRLQVQRGQSAGAMAKGTNTITTIGYRGVAECLAHAYRNGGIAGLFRGAGARVLHFAPATTVTMTAYETCRLFFAGLLQQ